MALLKVWCIFVHCVVCNRRWLDLLRIERLFGVRHSGRHRERLCVSALRPPELRVLKLDDVTLLHLIVKGIVNELHRCDGQNGCGALRTAVAVFARRMWTIWCKSLSQPLKCSPLTPHEAPELAKLQAESYVGVR